MAAFPGPPWVPAHFIGGTGGNPFRLFRGDTGNFVKTIVVHSDKITLRGIRVTYQDGQKSAQVGYAEGASAQITLDPDEYITLATLWGNGQGNPLHGRTGHIELLTSKGQRLDHGIDTSDLDPYTINVGSGFLGGFAGRAAVDIDSLSFIFLSTVKNVEIASVRYPHLPPNSKIVSQLLHQSEFYNSTSGPKPWDFGNSVERTNSVIFKTQISVTFGRNPKIKASIPVIEEDGSGYKWKLESEHTWGPSTSLTHEHHWQLKGVLKPLERITATSRIQRGAADVNYTAAVTIITVAGNLVFHSDGLLSIVQYSHAKASSAKGSARFHDEPDPVDDGRKRETGTEEAQNKGELPNPGKRDAGTEEFQNETGLLSPVESLETQGQYVCVPNA